VSGVAGWLLLAVVVLAAPAVPHAAARGERAFNAILAGVLPWPLWAALTAAIVVAQYLCGLATLTSASRMAFAFARDGGLPWSRRVRWVCPRRRSPPVAIWSAAVASAFFTLYTPVYATITAVSTIFLYASYVVPCALGARAHGKSWTVMGPWDLGAWYRPLAVLSTVGCAGLIVIGVQPPNQKSVWVVGGCGLTLAIVWFLAARHRFTGPPLATLKVADD
jgi:amino acid transporter